MGINRALSLAGLALAGGMITGCWGDCWCNGGSSKGSQPKTNQNSTATSSLGQQSGGWNNQQRSQELNVANTTAGQQPVAGFGGPVTGQQPQTTTSLPSAGAGSADTMPSMPSQVRTVSGTSTPPAATSNLNPPPVVPPPSSTQRDTWPQSSPVVAPPPPSLPPPPPTLPANSPGSSSTSRFTPASPSPSQLLPPETIPNQSKIPTLPPGPVPVE